MDIPIRNQHDAGTDVESFEFELAVSRFLSSREFTNDPLLLPMRVIAANFLTESRHHLRGLAVRFRQDTILVSPEELPAAAKRAASLLAITKRVIDALCQTEAL